MGNKIVALQTDPTTEGLVQTVPSLQATLNGMPIATAGSQLIYKGAPDSPVEFASGILLNGKPLTFVTAKTAAGAAILTGGKTTAEILGATHTALPGCSKATEEIRPSTIKLNYDYALKQLEYFCKELGEATFHQFFHYFFKGEGKNEIPVAAFGQLYKDARAGKILMPEIIVVRSGLVGGAAYDLKHRCIYVQESLVRKAALGKDIEANCLLFAQLMEEFGHYLDDILRNKYSGAKGDTQGDEGAVYSYFLSTFNIFKEEKIPYASAVIDGATYELEIDFSAIQKEINTLIPRYEREQEDNDGEQEHFGTGDGDPEHGFYGHRGIEEILVKGKVFTKESGLLNWIYLGNYMRDMSQLITPTTERYDDATKAKLDAVHPKIRGLSFFDPIKPNRYTLSLIVEILAAHDISKTTLGETKEVITGMGNKVADKFNAKPATVAEAVPQSRIQERIKDITEKAFKKGVQYGLDYWVFLRNFGGITQEELGVYRPEEHIDNPILASVYDSLKDEIFYCPEEGLPALDSYYGTKRYIRNSTQDKTGKDFSRGFDKNKNYLTRGGRYTAPPANPQYPHPANIPRKAADVFIVGKSVPGGYLPTAAHTMREKIKSAYDKYTAATDTYSRNKALCDLGAGLHILEDYFAHSNFCELLLIKYGISVYPWVDRNDEEIGSFYKEKRTATTAHATGDPAETGYIYCKDEPDLRSKFPEYENIPFPSENFNGFYFRFEQAIYAANRYTAVAGYMYRVLKLDKGMPLVWKQDNYLERLPVVTGYFGPIDMIHSLSEKIDSLFKDKELSAYSLLASNDRNYLLLDLADMLVLAYLSDMEYSQANEEKDAPKGVKASTLIKYYKEYLYYRNIVYAILDMVKKKNPVLAVTAKLLEVILNTMQEMLMRGVRRMFKLLLEMLDGSLKFMQNTQLMRKIGTNPSHTQLAKDDRDHPLHGLAASLAQKAVLDVGTLLFKGVIRKEITYKGRAATITDVLDVAEEYLSHPYDVSWADPEVIAWTKANQDMIVKLAKRNTQEKEDRETGKKIETTIEDLKKKYEEGLKEIEEFKKELGTKYEQLKQELEQVKRKIEEASEYIEDKIDKSKEYLEEKKKEIQQKLEEYRRSINNWWGNNNTELDGFMQHRYQSYFASVNMLETHKDFNIEKYQDYLSSSPYKHRQNDGAQILAIRNTEQMITDQIAMELRMAPAQSLAYNWGSQGNTGSALA